ncbi:MAG: caspase family protein, partial [Steroidobacteraceae bacterium]|nr:caspase family protein [Steroidobacteraceae bacterium]MDW8258843.1 caspase family protein [Gammaproteobacteria bacterium]
ELQYSRQQLAAREQEIAAARRSSANEQEQLLEARRQLQAREAELEQLRSTVQTLGTELAAVRELAERRRRELDAVEQPIAKRLLAGPELTLIEPTVQRTRDIVPVATLAAGAEQQTIVGRITAPAGLLSLAVNERSLTPNEYGVFRTDLPVGSTAQPVKIVAVDRQGKRAELALVLRPIATTAPTAADEPVASGERRLAQAQAWRQLDFGRYYALIIGNNDYQSLPDLSSPIADATALATLLEQSYGFKTTVLRNATRYEILSALNRLREVLTPEDNLLIYFAGHGELDEVNQRGNWLPVDAERDSNANWIPTTAVTDILNIMRAKHVLVIVDSCYAGAMTRSSIGRLRAGMTEAEKIHWLRTMSAKRARTVLTSGGLAPVMDQGGGQHSVFAKALLDVLRANNEPLDGQRLHREVAARVAYAAANLRFDQVPEYGPIRFAGHEAGEFFLVPRAAP